MLIFESNQKNDQAIVSVTRIRYVLLIFIFSLCIFFIFFNRSPIQLTSINLFLTTKSQPLQRLSSAADFLSFYDQQLFLLNSTSFIPAFHNHQLSFKLNLTSLSSEYSLSLQQNFSLTQSHLTVTCLKASYNFSNYQPICDILLVFHVKKSDSNKTTELILLSNQSSCSLSIFTIHPNLISITFCQIFPDDFRFRFLHRWSHLISKSFIISWPQWPLSYECLSSNQSPGFLRHCSHQNTLIHFSSQDLFLQEQTSLSSWLDLQYKTFVGEKNLSNEARNQIPSERAKNFLICSKQFHAWIIEYQKWHKNITSMLLFNQQSMTFEEQRNEILKYDIRFLVYEKNPSGIADRLVHLITTYLVALLTKRILIFDQNWPEMSEVLQSSLNYDFKVISPWSDQFNFLQKNFSKKVHWFSFDRYRQDYNYDEQFPERVLIFQGHTGAVIHTIDSNSSIYTTFLTKHLQMNTANIFGCLYHSLFTYKLSEIIQRVSLRNGMLNHHGHSLQEILRMLLSPKFFSVGLQIRSGDKNMNETLNHQVLTDYQEETLLDAFRNYFSCTFNLVHRNMKLLEKTRQIPVVFLIADNYQIRRAALKRWSFSYENKSDNFYIVSSSNPVLHIQHTENRRLACQLGLFDMLLYSLCQQHVISTNSGFGRVPAFVSLRQKNIYSLSLNEQNSCENEGVTFSSAGHQWSGI